MIAEVGVNFSDVRKVFDETLVQISKDQPDVQKYLLNHERKKVCQDNLCDQILIANGRNLRIDIKLYKELIQDIAKMFARAALKFAEEQKLSDLEKIRRRVENDRIENAKEMIREFEKDGVIKEIT